MAGYEHHAVSCAHCGAVMEAELGRYGLMVEADYWRSQTVIEHEYGWAKLRLTSYGPEMEDRDVNDSEYQGVEDVHDEEYRCSTCDRALGDDGFVLWAWDGYEDAARDRFLQDEFGSSPRVGPFDCELDDESVSGEVMTDDVDRFVSSWQGELEGKAEAKAKERLRTGVALAEFEAAWDTCCDAESGKDDNGVRWSCELEHGHEGPCQFDRHEYYVEVDGVQVWAWDDESWVTGEVVPVGVSPQMAALLQADALAELGL